MSCLVKKTVICAYLNPCGICLPRCVLRYLLGEDISAARLLDPNVLDTAVQFARGYNTELTRGGRDGLPLWITEAGAAWGGAIDTFGPAYIDGFWFLGKLDFITTVVALVRTERVGVRAGSLCRTFIGTLM